MKKIYLDNCATTATDKSVAGLVYRISTEEYGNPSSLHGVGADAYKLIGTARHQAAKVLAAQTSRVYFTSGGTESNNLAIFGAAYGPWCPGRHIVTTAIEHSSVLNSFRALQREGFRVTTVMPRRSDGRIHAEDIIDAVEPDTALVSFMYVNNETGEILPASEIISGVRAKNPDTLIHCDCVQGFAKLPFRLFEFDVDSLSASAHKLHGPKGVGCLYLKDRSRYAPRIFGGSQESGVKPGTENVASIAGFGEACDAALLRFHENLEHAQQLKQLLTGGLSAFGSVSINSPENSSPYILNFSLCGYDASDIVSYMSGKGIYISAGSACSKGTRSHVIRSMGLGEAELAGAIRVSFSKYNTADDVDAFLAELKNFIAETKCGLARS